MQKDCLLVHHTRDKAKRRWSNGNFGIGGKVVELLLQIGMDGPRTVRPYAVRDI